MSRGSDSGRPRRTLQRGLINHLDLTVSDLERSTAFYECLLVQLGYRRSSEYGGDVPNWVVRAGPGSLSIGLHRARSSTPHDRYSAGLHHVAFHATSRADVDAAHELVKRIGGVVLDPPAEYDYTPGYYAVFFAYPGKMPGASGAAIEGRTHHDPTTTYRSLAC